MRRPASQAALQNSHTLCHGSHTMPQQPASPSLGTALPHRASGPPRVLFATGSSGGHVTPALAVAEALRESGRQVHPIFVGPAGGVAERMVRAEGEELHPLEVHPIRGAGPARVTRGLAALPAEAVRSLGHLRGLRPDVVVGTGAHTSGPLLALAALKGIPTLVFEANVEVGLANRWLGPLVQAVAVAWPQTLGAFPTRGFLTGWPVSRMIREAGAAGSDRSSGGVRLLILGGSAGASDLDRAIGAALPHLVQLGPRLSVVHQASRTEVASIRETYRASGVEARVEPFLGDLATCYRNASLVVTRAGGATLSELAAVGCPAILVPLPAAGDHQVANARAWEEAGCARSLPSGELTGQALAAAIVALAQDPAALRRMGEAARALHRPDAAKRIADWCFVATRIR